MSSSEEPLTIEHAGVLDDLEETPGYVLSDPVHPQANLGLYSCSFCGVGDSGRLVAKETSADAGRPPVGDGVLHVTVDGTATQRRGRVGEDGRVTVDTGTLLVEPGGTLSGQWQGAGLTAREIERHRAPDGSLLAQVFVPLTSAATTIERRITDTLPTKGCVKLRASLVRQRVAFPIHVTPSVRTEGGGRRRVTYAEAISRLADLLLAHRAPGGKTLVYACGQIDYFTIFAMQEVFRLLGIRNLTGNAEHCLNAGAVHTELLTGQEGPFLTVEQGLHGPDRFYLLNGWNGLITHPPAFAEILKRPDLDAYLVEVMVTESATALARKLGPDRVLLIRPGTDPQLALAVAHEILTRYPDAVERRFLDSFADAATYERFAELALSERFEAGRVAARIAPEPSYAERLEKGIRGIAFALTRPDTVPVNIPSVGLSQTSGVVAHALWGDVLGMLGKFGLRAIGEPAGGVLRLPGQINAESEVQGLSRKYFMGRVPMERADDAAARMGLPADAYGPVAADEPRAALDYSDPNPAQDELFLFFGTQFESNMMGRPRWIEKLRSPGVRFVVVDPVPDPFSLEHADLVLPSPPHPATTKLYQNGEWKLSLSIPQKRAAPETRTDATMIYDVMAEIVRRVESDPAVAAAHPDLARHAGSGYLRERFAAGLTRVDGEVSRPQLWRRIQDYMVGGCGTLYCCPQHSDGRLISWEDLLEHGSVGYGGVGVHRFLLDYERSGHQPFRDVFGEPRGFRFFTPSEADLEFSTGIILNSGRSPLSEDPRRVRFATTTFNSGKATPVVDMPDENPVHISPTLAGSLKLATGDLVRVTGRTSGEALTLPVQVSDRVKGDTIYVSFHKSRAETERGQYLNTVTSHVERCAYTAQTRVKATPVMLERVAPTPAATLLRADTTHIDTLSDLPLWTGQRTPLWVADIIAETPDVYTFRFQGDPLCRFAYWPGQFCSFVLNIDGRKVVRSYSISSTPARPFALEVTIKRVPGGLVSNWLPDTLRIGDQVEISGPKGKFCLVPGRIPRKLLLLGAGSGITPIMSMARWLSDISADVDVRMFNSVRSQRDIIFKREIELLGTRYRSFLPMIIATTREAGGDWTGMTGRINRHMLEALAPDLHERHIYMCGPGGFMDSVVTLLTEAGYDLSMLHMESFEGLRTSSANKDSPVGTTLDGAGQQPTGPVRIELARSGSVFSADCDTMLLDQLEAQDVDVDYACRAGSCGDCKVKVLTGEVSSLTDDGLEPDAKRSGFVLSCVSQPRTDLVLDI